MKVSSRVIVELVGGIAAIIFAFSAYFADVPDRLWIGVGIGAGCILLGAAALTLQMQDR